MKKVVFFFMLVLFVQCSVHKQQTDYIVPDSLTENEKKLYIVRFQEAKAQYDLLCAECHNKRKGFKKQVPEFTEEQMSQYSIREVNEEHGEEFSQKEITPPVLNEIFFYLRHLKR